MFNSKYWVMFIFHIWLQLPHTSKNLNSISISFTIASAIIILVVVAF